MDQKTILILGAGTGGIVVARELRRHLGSQHRVVLVDRRTSYTFPASSLWIMMGWRQPDAVRKPLASLAIHGIEILREEVLEVAPDQRTVQTDRALHRYDYLVIALGAATEPGVLSGISAVHGFSTPEEASKLGQVASAFSGGRVAVVIAGIPHTAPPAPYEAAMLLESFFARRGTPDVHITIFTPEGPSLPHGSFGAGEALADLLTLRNVELRPLHLLTAVETDSSSLRFAAGSKESFDLLVAVPPQRAPDAVIRSGLTDTSGWIPVDPRTLRTRDPSIYAIGDVASVPLPDGGKLPKAGTFAVDHAEIVAFNIAQEIHNSPTQRVFTGAGFYFLETGNGRAGYIHGNFFEKSPSGIVLNEPSVTFHWGKVVHEKYWLWRWL